MQVMCAGCRQPMEMVEPATLTFVNLPAASVIVLEHPKQGFCLNCKTAVTLAIGALEQIVLVAAPVPASARERLIVMLGALK